MDEQVWTELTDAECWELLTGSQVGRVALSLANVPEIFPVNYTIRDRRIVFATAPGTKLFKLTANASVAFEVDHWATDTAWSIIIAGTAHAVEDREEIYRLEESDFRPWIDSPKDVFVAIDVVTMSGRRFPLRPDRRADA